ncbi:hypothetical protein NQ315_008605 [Exocentrus adspersus]|uniref:Phenoloxidase-activating factor 2 n=1 Tax=Exocentrus adspersus TaxID=1586481 RepID=A0AAV8W5P2_9CUCU|nr:hypothetical protein NQ315_008605 [Exocentrus adspersus]
MYVPVETTTPQGELVALTKCGEGKDLGVKKCVNYDKCDPDTGTILPEDSITNHSFGLIDISLPRIRDTFPFVMQLPVLALVLLAGHVRCQKLTDDTRNALGNLFTTTTKAPMKCASGLCLPGFEPVPTEPTDPSRGYIPKCGEGKDQGKRMCVNYDYCDPDTNTIIQNGVTAGFGVINISYVLIHLGLSSDKNFKYYNDVDSARTVAATLWRCAARSPQAGCPRISTPPPSHPPFRRHRPSPPVTTKPTITPSYCGIRNENGIDFKISGDSDNEAEYGEFPWMVAILNKNTNPAPDENFSFCGGSLISPSVVLTGAHCVYKFQAGDIKIRAGEWDSKTTRERLPYQERNVATIVSHRDFVPAGVFNDFALLVLENPLDKAEHIGTVCLPEQGQVINSRNCFVSGWGKNVFGTEGRYQDILKKIELPIVPKPQCQNALRKTRLGSGYILHDSFVCAGGEQGKDACSGDGGSPLVCPDPKNPARYLLTGMVAWGIGCGEADVPGVYADVARFRSWIDEQMRRLNLDTRPYTA